MHRRVETVRRFGDRRVHRFQVVRERQVEGSERRELGEDLSGRLAGGSGREPATADWIVVDLDPAGEAVTLASTDLGRTRSVDLAAFREGRFVPVVAGGVPVWGY